MENIELVIKTLEQSEEPLKAGEIAEKSGIDKAEVEKAIKKLKKDDKIDSPKRCYYALKK